VASYGAFLELNNIEIFRSNKTLSFNFFNWAPAGVLFVEARSARFSAPPFVISPAFYSEFYRIKISRQRRVLENLFGFFENDSWSVFITLVLN